MTDKAIEPATDERIAAYERGWQDNPPGGFIDALIARIRQEQAARSIGMAAVTVAADLTQAMQQRAEAAEAEVARLREARVDPDVWQKLQGRRMNDPFLHRALTCYEVGSVNLETALAIAAIAASEAMESARAIAVDALHRTPPSWLQP
jgi:hypothetical protein